MRLVFCAILLISSFSYTSNEDILDLFGMSDNFIVNFHKNLCRGKYFKIKTAKKDKNWRILKNLYEKHIVKNMKYSEKPRIPKIIHQIWLGGNGKLPKKYHRFQKSWMDNHPDWEYILWTEKEIEKFGLTNRNLFNETNNYGAQSDIARYEILYRIGGLYVDTDFECIKPFDIFHHICDFYGSVTYCPNTELANGIIGSIPGHPVLKRAIENIRPRNRKIKDRHDVFNRTGPLYFTQQFFKGIKEHDGPCIIFPAGYFLPWPNYLRESYSPELVKKWTGPEAFCIHYWEISWQK